MRRHDLIEIYAGVRLAQIFGPILIGIVVFAFVLVDGAFTAVVGPGVANPIVETIGLFGIVVCIPGLALWLLWCLFRTVFPKAQKPSRAAPRVVERVEPRLHR